MNIQRFFWLAALLVACAGAMPAQTQVRLKDQSQDYDMTNAPLTRPNRVGTALPGACQDAEMFFLLTAQPGQNLYGCVSGTWKVMGDGAGGGAYAAALKAEAVKTITAQQHGLTSPNLAASCFNGSGDRVEGIGVKVNSSTLQVDVSFPAPFTGTCVLIGSGAGSGGGGVGTPSGTAGGDLSGSYPNPVLVPSGVTAGTYGGATQIPQIQVDSKGRIVSATQVGVSGGGGGSITSVGLSLPAEFTVSGSPVTGSGSLSASWASQAAGKVMAAPSGSMGTPSFRALAQSDLPVMNGDSGSGGAKGAVPAPAAGDAAAGKFLKADGTWAVAALGNWTAGNGIAITGTEIGVSAEVAQRITSAASYDFPSIAAQTCAEFPLTLTGVAAGDEIAPGWPATLEAGLAGVMIASSANTVVVRVCNVTANAINPVAQTFRATSVRGF